MAKVKYTNLTKSEQARVVEAIINREVVYQNGEVIERNGAKTANAPKVRVSRTYSAKKDSTAIALRYILPDALSQAFSDVYRMEEKTLVRTTEKDYVISVVKIKVREESYGFNAKSPLAKVIEKTIDSLDGLCATGTKNNAVLVENLKTLEQYEIKIVAKRDRVTV